MNLHEKIARIQKELDVPKDLWNDFSKFKYRSCESILKAVKPLLDGLVLTLNDEIVEVAGRVYVKATARLAEEADAVDGSRQVSVSAFARESLEKVKFDAAQLTGSASTYARKYALCGLFAIDDTQDSDAQNTEGKSESHYETKTGKKDTPTSQTVTPPGLQIIIDITQKSGKKKNGSTWTRYKITDGNKTEYSTFDKNLADIAKIAMEKKAFVLFEHENDQYKTLKLIEMVDEKTGEASGNLTECDENGDPE